MDETKVAFNLCKDPEAEGALRVFWEVGGEILQKFKWQSDMNGFMILNDHPGC